MLPKRLLWFIRQRDPIFFLLSGPHEFVRFVQFQSRPISIRVGFGAKIRILTGAKLTRFGDFEFELVVQAVHELPCVNDRVRRERVAWDRICRVLVGDWDTRRRLLVGGAFEEERAVRGGGEGNEVVSVAFSSRRMVNQRRRKRESFVDRRRRGVGGGELRRRRGRRDRSRRSWRRGFWSRRTHFELNLTNTELWKIWFGFSFWVLLRCLILSLSLGVDRETEEES